MISRFRSMPPCAKPAPQPGAAPSQRARKVAILALIFSAATASSMLAAATGEPIVPVPHSLATDPAKVAIGRQLFNDVRLSGNRTVSCASCHDVTKGGADSRVYSTGLNGEMTAVNAPTVFNAALNFKQFWDGRADTIEDQVEAVVANPVEMGSTWPSVVAMVAGDATYRTVFAAAYRDGVTKANIQNAIASYERALITPDSRFDRYLRGDGDALTPVEKAGYAKFKESGCVACHQGVNVGGNMFQKFGVMTERLVEDSPSDDPNLGRYRVTGDTDDMHVFKVPSLRNVALTAPYFHDGSAATLEAAVEIMFRVQLGRKAAADDKNAIVAFLKTLSARPVGEPK